MLDLLVLLTLVAVLVVVGVEGNAGDKAGMLKSSSTDPSWYLSKE